MQLKATTLPDQTRPEGEPLDAAYLHALADLAESRGNVRFTPGGGVLFDTPMRREERLALPEIHRSPARFLDLPQDRFAANYTRDGAFRSFVDTYTVAHRQPGYRLVVIPLSTRLTPQQLRVIADAAETFGHGSIRLTADVSIRLPNVPTALLRPLYSALRAAGLAASETPARLAA